MKKNYLLLLAAVCVIYHASGQCTIDSAALSSPGVYPSDTDLPHIVQNVAYNQTVTGKIQSSFDTTLLTITFTVNVDSVLIDSLQGLPSGITWTRAPNVIKGGGYGCAEFTGTTGASPGQYALSAYGTAWGHLINSTFGVDTPISYSGDLNQFSPWGGYYLTVVAAGGISASATSTNVSCAGGDNGTATAAATGASSYTYHWSNNDTSAIINNLMAGTYTVTVTGSNSATATASVMVTQPTALVLTDSTLCSTGSNGKFFVGPSGGTPPYTYHFSNSTTSEPATGLAPGNYQVTVTDANSCSTTTNATVSTCTGIYDMNENSFNLQVYPNPASGEVYLAASIDNAAVAEITVTDIAGRVLYNTQTAINGALNTSIPVQGYASGLYVVTITANQQLARQRFVVAH